MSKSNHEAIIGKVTNNKDPDKLGRVKVFLEKLGGSFETNWIPVLNIYGGSFFIPEVDDYVIVAFLGSSNHGVVLGSVWNYAKLPPETGENNGSDLNQDGENNLRFIKSRSGHMLIIDDKEGEEKIQIISSGGGTKYEFITLDEKINIETDVDLILSAKGKLGIKAEVGDIRFDKGLKIETNDLSVETKGKGIKSKASKDVAMEGGSVTLN